ncbi:ROK family protein [Alkalihalobacillus trypoxylicola]|uniref:HTH marR-type domain-containing protein n=1 Tax=Alkalihalobacillus trypoxylicola TaxID=519424 RepID=A0A162F300_9BACI|nr:ROK family protein [Alkalihalobacillus trypoxylicola]KYG34375.1 hypothetical protein AZF04_14385 [Alkalihalobacillus trypoxylicola]
MATEKFNSRQTHEKLLLELILKEKQISRADLAKKSQLNKATVSTIIKELLEKELILEIGTGTSSGGRRPVLLTFNSKAGLALSLNIGYNYIHSALAFLNGEIISRQKTSELIDKNSIISLIKQHIYFHTNDIPNTSYHIIGATIAIHGIVYNQTIQFTPYYSLADVHLKEKLETEFSFPIFLENEANLSALGEKTFSTKAENLVSITIGTGIGAGVIINHQLYTGKNGYCGEIGHTIVVPNGQSCPCGNDGCLEQYASEKNLLDEFRKHIQNAEASFDEFINACKRHEPVAQKLIDKFVTFFSYGLNNIIHSYNPDVVIVNSRLTKELPEIMERLKQQFSNPIIQQSNFLPSNLHQEAILLGGFFVAVSNFLSIDHFDFIT